VAIEAGAMRVPVVATRVDGVVDAVDDGVTGLLVRPRDAVQLAEAIERLMENPELRESMGSAARVYVLNRFRRDRITAGLLCEYQQAVANRKKPSILYRAAKRFFDVMGALTLAILTLPIWALAALAIRSSLGGPVIFQQERGGLGGKPFVAYKFRTMQGAR